MDAQTLEDGLAMARQILKGESRQGAIRNLSAPQGLRLFVKEQSAVNLGGAAREGKILNRENFVAIATAARASKNSDFKNFISVCGRSSCTLRRESFRDKNLRSSTHGYVWRVDSGPLNLNSENSAANPSAPKNPHRKALILSDGRKGHENQSIAFCELKGLDFCICKITYANKLLKLCSYALDFFGLYFKIFKCDFGEGGTAADLKNGSNLNSPALNSSASQNSVNLDAAPNGTNSDAVSYNANLDALADRNLNFADFNLFVGTGSTSYYALKFYARRYAKPSVALMYPKGYRKDFSVIIAGAHDRPPPRANLKISPVSLSFSRPQGLYQPQRKSIGFIIGGPNSCFEMGDEILKQIEAVRAQFADCEFALTTSPRTPRVTESALAKLSWDYSVIYSREPVNPIGDFLAQCEWVFISEDSVSMISEAVSNGSASVAILSLKRKDAHNKFDDFISSLVSTGYARRYDEALKKTAKYDLKAFVREIEL
ncbi:ELM1/GtrOC1 family putative glycosyltransferase [uncultured Campylobacter sp.]|uniref:ELM1/GtrOC1 family putative glycosyltransferase n=1 Tax=uncultured Campylobacter sp. TaxID=218934 RepID=UPI002639A496|nr:ELM1/GtrOC1 family putative glycosyltransferase [uncultured Campylobacter sp.]